MKPSCLLLFLKLNITCKYLMSEVFREENYSTFLFTSHFVVRYKAVFHAPCEKRKIIMLLTLCGKGKQQFFSSIGDHMLFSQGCIPNKWGTSHCAV